MCTTPVPLGYLSHHAGSGFTGVRAEYDYQLLHSSVVEFLSDMYDVLNLISRITTAKRFSILVPKDTRFI